eukprot:3439822-Rhodomonas_salina.1
MVSKKFACDKSEGRVSHGSFPGLRNGTNGTLRPNATGAAKQYPLHSIPTTAAATERIQTQQTHLQQRATPARNTWKDQW